MDEIRANRPSQTDAEAAAVAAGVLPQAPAPQQEYLDLMDRLRATVAELEVRNRELEQARQAALRAGLERIGQGGMGAVYKAWDQQVNIPVALKVVRTEAGAGEGDGAHRLHLVTV